MTWPLSGEPVEGATVNLWKERMFPPGWVLIRTTETVSDGRYIFTLLDTMEFPNEYKVQATYQGHSSLIPIVSVWPGEMQLINLRLLD